MAVTITFFHFFLFENFKCSSSTYVTKYFFFYNQNNDGKKKVFIVHAEESP